MGHQRNSKRRGETNPSSLQEIATLTTTTETWGDKCFSYIRAGSDFASKGMRFRTRRLSRVSEDNRSYPQRGTKDRGLGLGLGSVC